MEIPANRLASEILSAIIDEFVAREGTDYGASEVSFEAKTRQVRNQIDRGQVVICFDPKTESCTLLTRQQFQVLMTENCAEDNSILS
ncbi:MAG: YheU family protein [Pseudomonadales bacterium]|nr:YheU family protein [Pseudomonadales bacterium]